MRVALSEFQTHYRQHIGSQSFASRNKQADIFDSQGQRLGFLNQYRSNSFSTYLGDGTLTHNCFMQVRNYLARTIPGGYVVWR